MAESTRKGSRRLAVQNVCRWSGCQARMPFPTVAELVGHVEEEHLKSFEHQDYVVCLWEGCKVFNNPCPKKAWLPQHMRRHTNERPHKCIMNGCHHSFWSAEALNNHLQLHLKPLPSPVKQAKKKPKAPAPPPVEAPSPSLQEPIVVDEEYSPPKRSHFVESDEEWSSQSEAKKPMMSEKAKRQPLALKVKIPLHSNTSSLAPFKTLAPVPVNGGLIHDESMDYSTMATIKRAVVTQYQNCCSAAQQRGSQAIEQDVICLTGQIIGRRKPLATPIATPEAEVLVRWTPRIILDSWVPISKYKEHRYLSISSLLHVQKTALIKYLSCSTDKETRTRKRKVSNP